MRYLMGSYMRTLETLKRNIEVMELTSMYVTTQGTGLMLPFVYDCLVHVCSGSVWYELYVFGTVRCVY